MRLKVRSHETIKTIPSTFLFAGIFLTTICSSQSTDLTAIHNHPLMEEIINLCEKENLLIEEFRDITRFGDPSHGTHLWKLTEFGELNVTVMENFRRSIGLGFIQNYFEFGTIDSPRLELTIIQKEDDPVKIVLVDGNRIIYSKTEKEVWQSYVAIQKQIFSSEIDSNDLELSLYKLHQIGMFCGTAGVPPAKCREMLHFVNNHDKSSILKWLKSMNPELQVYAMMGLKFMEYNGDHIEDSEKQIMISIKKRKTHYSFCSGCSWEYISSSELIKYLDFKRLFKKYKHLGYLD